MLAGNLWTQIFNSFQLSCTFHTETSYLISTSNQMTGFCIKCTTRLKQVKLDELTKVVRKKSDLGFAETLNKIREGQRTGDGIQKFKALSKTGKGNS